MVFKINGTWVWELKSLETIKSDKWKNGNNTENGPNPYCPFCSDRNFQSKMSGNTDIIPEICCPRFPMTELNHSVWKLFEI